MEDVTPQHRRSLDLIEQLQRSIEQGGYHLTRDDSDMLFYELEKFKQKLNDVYRRRAHG